MKINKQQIEHLAKLARLKISDSEEKQLEKEVADILDFISKLKEVDTTGVEPSFYGIPANNLMRQDKVVVSDDKNDVLKALPDTKDGLLKTPKIFS